MLSKTNIFFGKGLLSQTIFNHKKVLKIYVQKFISWIGHILTSCHVIKCHVCLVSYLALFVILKPDLLKAYFFFIYSFFIFLFQCWWFRLNLMLFTASNSWMKNISRQCLKDDPTKKKMSSQKSSKWISNFHSAIFEQNMRKTFSFYFFSLVFVC